MRESWASRIDMSWSRYTLYYVGRSRATKKKSHTKILGKSWCVRERAHRKATEIVSCSGGSTVFQFNLSKWKLKEKENIPKLVSYLYCVYLAPIGIEGIDRLPSRLTHLHLHTITHAHIQPKVMPVQRSQLPTHRHTHTHLTHSSSSSCMFDTLCLTREIGFSIELTKSGPLTQALWRDAVVQIGSRMHSRSPCVLPIPTDTYTSHIMAMW